MSPAAIRPGEKSAKVSPTAASVLAGIDTVKERPPGGSASISADEIQHFKRLVS
jgi:hypothetical protein